MARIEPFKAIRPPKDLVHKVAAPPYDVINSEEAAELAKGNPHSLLHITKPEIDLPADIDHYSDAVYNKGKENFAKFLADKILIQDTKNCFYLYKQIWNDHVQIGIVAGASCKDYQDDIIKKHELTREDKEKDRMRHIETLNAHIEPVFLTYKHRQSIDDLFTQAMKKDPVYDFVSTHNNVRQILYVIDDENLITAIKKEFAAIDYLYVADGHHRSASATLVKIKHEKANPNHTGNEEYNFFLTVIFPDNQMKILPYNRVVKDLNGLTKQELFNKISEKFNLAETNLKAPEKPDEFCIYIDKQWYKMTPKPGSYDPDDPIASLDVSILQNNLLAPILGIENPRKDKRIDFVGGIRGTAELQKLVDNGQAIIAFSLFHTTIEQLFKVADSGKIMPPKSTWFEPKLESGLFIHTMD